MYAIAAFGLLTMILGLLMIASPESWSRGILSFSRKRYFHAAEIWSRLIVGGALVFFASQTLHPRFIAALGYLLMAVAVGLLVAGGRVHRAFAVRSATFVSIFRPAGVVAVVFGAFIVYSALG